MYVLTMCFSITRDKTEVMDIGRNCYGKGDFRNRCDDGLLPLLWNSGCDV